MERLTRRENGEVCVIDRDNNYKEDITDVIIKALRKLADYEDAEENGLLVRLPCKVGDMVDKFFSHNTIIALWYEDPTDRHYSDMLWRGMAWNIPENYKSLPFVKFMGIVAETVYESDTLNIKIEFSKEAEQALNSK